MGLFQKLFGRPEAAPPARASRQPALRILVAEPSITVGKVIELTLEDAEVTRVSTAADAQKALARQPHLVIASVVLADGDGYELCRKIKADPFHACPVILLHGTFESFDAAKAQACGADAVLTKPFEPAALLDAVSRTRKP